MIRPGSASPASHPSRRAVLGLLAGAAALAGAGAGVLSGAGAAHAAGVAPLGQSPVGGPGSAVGVAGPELVARIEEIINRPEFAGSRWGMHFYALDTGESLYALNQTELFTPASTRKIFPAATAFTHLGPGYRFHTQVYGTGPVVNGVLHGDLVLVASGDLLLGSRIQPDGSIAVPMPDHSYASVGGAPLPGDPLRIIGDMAAQVAAKGVRQVRGRVRVDASLFREEEALLANGRIPLTVSPMMINDHLIYLEVAPGRRAGARAELRVTPESRYVQFRNRVRTVASDATDPAPLQLGEETVSPNGTKVVELTGEVREHGDQLYDVYYVREPIRFAELTFTDALRGAGVQAREAGAKSPAPAVPAGGYPARYRLAEHISPPLSEAAKVMLKVSSNIHTVHFPYLVGAIAANDPENALETGMELQEQLIAEAGLDSVDAGAAGGRYSPDYFITFLSYLAEQPYLPDLRDALPIMGRDGTIGDIQVESPAAGRVFAKTGTGIMPDTGELHLALAGYIALPDDRSIAFAQFTEAQGVQDLAALTDLREAQGEVITAVYEAAVE